MPTSTKVVNPWLTALSIMLTTFMEVLDSTVVNVSIPHIAGSLGATYDEGTWVVTSYLVANAIVLPIAAWLARYFGRRRLLMFCVAGFATFSVLCGAATSLGELIFFRIFQGLSGGGLQPLAQAILLESFPKRQRGQAMAAYGLGIICAPIIGPTLGGWITDNFSWRWIFFINLPIGLLSLALMARYVHDPPYLRRNKDETVDLFGIALLIVGLGALQIMLDTGQRHDWFGARAIRIEAALFVASLATFVWRELRIAHPVVDLRVMQDRSYTIGMALMTAMSFCLYASAILLPRYMETLLGYPALQAGLTLSPRGVASFLSMIVVGAISARLDPRKILTFGFLAGALTMFAFARLNLNAGFWDFFWPQLGQGAAMACMYLPLMTCAMDTIPREKMGNAASVLSLTRNIGGSAGVALMTTLLARRTQFHQSRLIEHLRPGMPAVDATLQRFAHFFFLRGADATLALRRAYGALYGMVARQASMLSFIEAFTLMGVIFLLLIPPISFMARPTQKSSEDAADGEEPSTEALQL